MSNKPAFRRRNYFIKKRFQLDFSIRFLILIVIEALFAAGLFIYLSRNTLTTGYIGSDLKIAKTSDFFLPTLLLSNLIILGVTAVIGIVVLILISHRIAGPLYRFEKSLSDIGKGDLTHRFKVREKDQLAELADSINEFTSIMDKKAGDIKYKINEVSKLFSEIQSAVSSSPSTNKELESILLDASKKVGEIEDAVNYFKTSKDLEIKR
ncbi:MAG: methyl-accepting chemotaxis protein [Deltaproteobacteria bacterium]|nr:methyl-accepting chemotaxis protein [Deltaproteobacteria bacterium]